MFSIAFWWACCLWRRSGATSPYSLITPGGTWDVGLQPTQSAPTPRLSIPPEFQRPMGDMAFTAVYERKPAGSKWGMPCSLAEPISCRRSTFVPGTSQAASQPDQPTPDRREQTCCRGGGAAGGRAAGRDHGQGRASPERRRWHARAGGAAARRPDRGYRWAADSDHGWPGASHHAPRRGRTCDARHPARGRAHECGTGDGRLAEHHPSGRSSAVTVSTDGLRHPDAVRGQHHSDNVGGPSAGFMFALGTLRRSNGRRSTRGHFVAGTGTIALDGAVGPSAARPRRHWRRSATGRRCFLRRRRTPRKRGGGCTT